MGRITLAVVGLSALVAVGIACSGSSSSEDATTKLCSDLTTMNAAVREFQSLNQSSTVDDAKTAKSDLDKAMADVKSSASSVANARVDNLDSATSDLDQTISSLEGSQTIGSAQAQIQSSVSALVTARSQLNDAVKCPTATAQNQP